jgi:S-adenosylmethionine hydrolase
MRPVIALHTDFGLQDHYVGAVRGAVLAAGREANVVDIVHDLPPHDVVAGAYALEAAHASYPAGTAFLAEVEPGVGSERRGVAIAAGGYRFAGPDNGIFTLILAAYGDSRVHEITNAGLFRYEVAATFHARDIFAPVTARLASGMPIEEVGPQILDPVRFAIEVPHQVREGTWQGSVVLVDRFGNLTTSVTRPHLDAILETVGGDPTELVVLVEGVVLPFVRTYADIAEGEACALVGSSGRLEIAVHRGNASRVLGATRGAPVRVRRV